MVPALLASFKNSHINLQSWLMGFLLCKCIADCPRFRTIENPSTKQHQSVRKPLTTADTSTFSHSHHISQPKLQTLWEKIGRESSFGSTSHLDRKNVSIDIRRTFLKLLDAKFTEEHLLHKIFNRNTVKISYSCMPNLNQNIDGHNKSSLPIEIVPSRCCNYRIKRIGCLPNDRLDRGS